MPTNISAIIRLLLTNYGPLGFGVILLLIVWQIIVIPQLERNKVQTDTLVQVADVVREAAVTLRIVTEKLDRISERMTYPTR
jgi:hypothetical protein